MTDAPINVTVGQWVVYDDGWNRAEVAVAETVTPKQVRVKRKWGGDRLAHLKTGQVLLATDSEAHARKTAERLLSARAESDRRQQAARAWLVAEEAKIIAAAQEQPA